MPKKQLPNAEAVIADEEFFAWRYGTDAAKAQAWQFWLAANPDYQPLVNEAIACLDEITIADKAVPASQTEAAHGRLIQAIAEAQTPVRPMHTRRLWVWMAAAATLLAAIIGYQVLTPQKQGTVLAAAYGQVSRHTLPDGSVVTLNANSRITLGDDWAPNKTREVWLEGEGFFEVNQTAAKTGFVVHAAGMDVVVTGTKFNLVNRGSEQSVLLTEGSVTLKTLEGKEVCMAPGEFVKLAEREPKKIVAPQAELLAWKEAKLVFNNANMSHVAAIIKRHYGINVQLADGVAEKTVTGILPNNNLNALLEALQAAKGLRITQANNGITIANTPTL